MNDSISGGVTRSWQWLFYHVHLKFSIRITITPHAEHAEDKVTTAGWIGLTPNTIWSNTFNKVLRLCMELVLHQPIYLLILPYQTRFQQQKLTLQRLWYQHLQHIGRMSILRHLYCYISEFETKSDIRDWFISHLWHFRSCCFGTYIYFHRTKLF